MKMRVPRRVVPIQPLTYMWERHKEIARLVVTGLRPIDISGKLGIQPCRLSIIMNSPVFKEYLLSLSERRNEVAFDMKKELMEGAENGVKKLNSFLDDEEVPKSLKAKIAMDFLDRTGYGKVTLVKSESTVTHLTEGRLERLKREAKELLSGVKVLEIEGSRVNE